MNYYYFVWRSEWISWNPAKMNMRPKLNGTVFFGFHWNKSSKRAYEQNKWESWNYSARPSRERIVQRDFHYIVANAYTLALTHASRRTIESDFWPRSDLAYSIRAKMLSHKSRNVSLACSIFWPFRARLTFLLTKPEATHYTWGVLHDFPSVPMNAIESFWIWMWMVDAIRESASTTLTFNVNTIFIHWNAQHSPCALFAFISFSLWPFHSVALCRRWNWFDT